MSEVLTGPSPAHLRQMVKDMEQDLARSGAAEGEVTIESLMEMDAFLLLARDREGKQVRGIVFRSRVGDPTFKVITTDVHMVGDNVGELLDRRLPSPPAPSAKPEEVRTGPKPQHILAPSASERAAGRAIPGMPIEGPAPAAPKKKAAKPAPRPETDDVGAEEEAI